MNRIVVITDCVDVASSEVYATIVSTLDKLGASDVTVEPIIKSEPFSVHHGNFLSRLIIESYIPENLTILSIINPLDTSDKRRARIIAKLKNGVKLVGANTGVFSWLIDDFGIEELYESDPTGLKGETFISFGGKYIHAPIAAQVAATGNLSSAAYDKFDSSELLTIKHERGQVLHIDNFGVAKIYLKDSQLRAKPGDKLIINTGNGLPLEATYCSSMKELKNGTLAVYKGSSLEMLEIGIVRELNTSNKLGLQIGSLVEIRLSSSL